MKISTYTLVNVAKATSLFMGKKDARPQLNGVHLVKKAGELIVEASDGHRAAQVRIDCDDVSEFDVIIEREAWLAVSKIKTSKKDGSFLELSIENATIIQTSGSTIAIKFIDARYPDVNRVLRASPPKTASLQIEVGINANYAVDALKASSILASVTKLIVTSPSDKLTIETATQESGFPGLTKPAVFVVMPVRL